MFYEPGKTDHNLPFDPFKACVVPRPIGWISTVSATGESANLAPYSQFQNLTFDPPYVMFSANQTPENTRKDSVINAEATGIFCWQLATYPLREAVNVTSEQVPYGVDEFERAKLERTYSQILTPKRPVPGFRGVPMVKDSPVRFECEYHSTVRLPGNPPMGTVDIVIGKVVGVHIDDSVINLETGKVDVAKTEPIARCGYYDYAVVRECFEMKMPGAEIMRAGLEGSSKKNREANKVKEDVVEEPTSSHWAKNAAPDSYGTTYEVEEIEARIASDKPKWSTSDIPGYAGTSAPRPDLNRRLSGNGAPSPYSSLANKVKSGQQSSSSHWEGHGAPSTFGSAYEVKEVEARIAADKPKWNESDIPGYGSTLATNPGTSGAWSGNGAPSTYGSVCVSGS